MSSSRTKRRFESPSLFTSIWCEIQLKMAARAKRKPSPLRSVAVCPNIISRSGPSNRSFGVPTAVISFSAMVLMRRIARTLRPDLGPPTRVAVQAVPDPGACVAGGPISCVYIFI